MRDKKEKTYIFVTKGTTRESPTDARSLNSSSSNGHFNSEQKTWHCYQQCWPQCLNVVQNLYKKTCKHPPLSHVHPHHTSVMTPWYNPTEAPLRKQPSMLVLSKMWARGKNDSKISSFSTLCGLRIACGPIAATAALACVSTTPC